MHKHTENFLSRLSEQIKHGNAIFFFGAGASVESGLPAAWSLVDNAITKLASRDLNASRELFKLRSDIINKTVSSDWPRLEKVMQLLINNVGERAIELLDIYDLGQPNDGHIFIIQAAEQFGCCDFFTTNFDSCLQKAGKQFPNIKINTVVTKSDFGSVQNSKSVLNNVLLHGTLPKQAVHKEEIVATIDTILYALPEYKWNLLHDKTKDRALVFIGYSASDIDLRPRIAELKPTDVFWIDTKEIPIHAKELLGSQWKAHFEQMSSGVFFKCLRERLQIPLLPRNFNYSVSSTENVLQNYIEKWMKLFDKDDTMLFLVDLFIFMGKYSAAYNLLNSIDISGINNNSKLDVQIKKAELLLREFKFSELRELVKQFTLVDASDDVKKRLLIANYYHSVGDIASATKIANETASIVSSNENKARVSKFLGKLDIYDGCTQTGEKLLKESANLFYQAGRMEERISVLNDLAVINQRRGNLDVAENILKEVISISQEIGDTYQHARAENNFGEVLRFRGLLSKARGHYDIAGKLANLIDAEDISLIMLCNYGLTYYSEKDYPRAKQYFEKAIESFSTKRGLLEDLGNAYINLGMVLIKEDAPAEGLEKLEQAEHVFKTLQAKSRLVSVNLYRIYAYLAQGKIEAAEELFESSFDQTETPTLKFQIHYLKGMAHFNLKRNILIRSITPHGVSDSLNICEVYYLAKPQLCQSLLR